MKTLKLIFASLFRNDAAMEGRFQKWYLAAILFLLSVILATVPLFANTAGTSGSDFMGRTLYSFDTGIQRFSEALVTNDVDLVVTADGEYKQLVDSADTFDTAFSDVEGAANFNFFSYKDHTDATKLKVYFQGDATDEEATTFLNSKLAMTNSATAINLDIVSFMFLARRAVYLYIYNPAEVAAGTSAGADYKTVLVGDYLSFSAGMNLQDLGRIDEFGNPIAAPATAEQYQDYQVKILRNWQIFFDDAYANNKQVLLWTTTAIMLAVNTVLGIFMSLLIFIMTRGKNNPNRTLKFGEAFKIGGWLLLSPALIALVIGFIFPNYASMAFVLLVGLRMMWLSSKTLRPPLAPAAPQKK